MSVTIPLTKRSVKTGGPVNASINVQTTADSFGARTGRDLQALGKGADAIATELDTISARVVDRENKQNVRKAVEEYTAFIRKHKIDMLDMQGENAKGVTAAIALSLREKQDELLGTLANPTAQEAYTSKVFSITESALDTASIYEQDQFSKGEIATIEALNVTAIESAIGSFDNQGEIDAYTVVVINNINDLAAKQGWSEEQRAQKLIEQTTKIDVGVINNLAEFNPTKAREYFEKAKKAGRITGDVYDDINKVIKAGDVLGQAYKAFDRITADGTDSTKWDAEAKKLDPEVRAKVETMISNRRARDTALATAATKAHTENAIRSILDNKDPSLVDSIKGDAAKIQKFQDWHDKRQDRTTPEGNIRLWEAIYRKDQDFANMSLYELYVIYGPGVGKTDMNKIIAHHAAVKEGLAKNTRWAQTDVELFMQANSDFFGMTDAPNDKDTMLQASFKRAMYNEIDNYRNANNGEEPTQKWVNTTATRLFTEKGEHGKMPPGADWGYNTIRDEHRQFQADTTKRKGYEILKGSMPSPDDFHPEFIAHVRKIYREGFAAKNKPIRNKQGMITTAAKNVFASKSRRKIKPMPDQYIIDTWESYVKSPENMVENNYTGPLLKRE